MEFLIDIALLVAFGTYLVIRQKTKEKSESDSKLSTLKTVEEASKE
jgi:hypothetical protein